MRNTGKGRNDGNVLLFSVAILFIIISLVSILTITLISRSNYVRKSADLNAHILLLEDANVRYQAELEALEAETQELVEYYLLNNFCKQVNTNYRGKPQIDNRKLNEHLREIMTSQAQRAIAKFYEEKYTAQEIQAKDPETNQVDYNQIYEGLVGDANDIARFLYGYILMKRLGSSSASHPYSLNQKLTKITGSVTDSSGSRTINGEITEAHGGTPYGTVSFRGTSGGSLFKASDDAEELQNETERDWQPIVYCKNMYDPDSANYRGEVLGAVYINSLLELEADVLITEGVQKFSLSSMTEVYMPEFETTYEDSSTGFQVNIERKPKCIKEWKLKTER